MGRAVRGCAGPGPCHGRYNAPLLRRGPTGLGCRAHTRVEGIVPGPRAMFTGRTTQATPFPHPPRSAVHLSPATQSPILERGRARATALPSRPAPPHSRAERPQGPRPASGQTRRR
ncbi:hypothetical protein F751_2130 [Auxenochlorella protothecoides]|uniref:Uncharacterized protein n=1 Tax=Auxenochlorella protothecoides TaxID=3075 RepID=A0A087SLD9_AUXPR|nr:hypothetical protein F751_2130 [Auxenochlorella protothecoides]KFM26543.1 hypothetical protein F751_2130 [Auxenochlorella protothecoides]